MDQQLELTLRTMNHAGSEQRARQEAFVQLWLRRMESVKDFGDVYRRAMQFAAVLQGLDFLLKLVDDDGDCRLAFRADISDINVVTVELFWSEEHGVLMAVGFRNDQDRRILASTPEGAVIEVESSTPSSTVPPAPT